MKHVILLFALVIVPVASMAQLAEVGAVDKELRFEEEISTFNNHLTKEEIAANEQEHRRLQREREKLRQSIGQYDKQNKILDTRLEKSRNSLAKSQALHLEESKILEKTKGKNERLQTATAALDQDLAQAESLIVQQRDQVSSLRRDISEAERRQVSLLKRQDQLKKDLIQQRKLLKKLRAQREKLERKNKKLSADVDKLEGVSREVGHTLSRLD